MSSCATPEVCTTTRRCMNCNATNKGEDGREIARDDEIRTGDGCDARDAPVKDSDATTGADEDLTAPVEEFDDMNLHDDLLRGIYGYGFEKPSMIQQRAIRPLAFSGRDLIAQAQSGTGKTATFAIGLLQNIDPTLRSCQAIILSPTRELARQSAAVASALGRCCGVTVLACIGGTSMREQASTLRRGVGLVVGTPGRVLDLLEKRILDVDDVHTIVLDEADEMLGLGFKDQIHDVLTKLPREAKIALFSATLPPESLELAAKWMPDCLRIIVKKEELTLAGIRSFYVYCGDDERHKLGVLTDLYDNISITQAVIFCNHRRRVDWLQHELGRLDFTVSTIHSELTQEERTAVMKSFRAGEARVLIATDVLARGIDVQQVNLVINYDLPRDLASYIHRVGRSGRFGRKGSAISLIAGQTDVRSLREIEQYYATEINELPEDLSVLE